MAPKKKPAATGGDGPPIFDEFCLKWKKLEKEFDTAKLKEAEKMITRIQEEGDDKVCGWTFSQPFDQMAFRILMQAMRQSGYNKVRALRLWKCDGGNEAVRSICHYLDSQPPTAVEELQFTDCGITELGCEFLGDSMQSGILRPCSPITFLRLDFNQIGHAGVEALSLTQNSTLRYLSLRYCNIGPKGGYYLSHILIFVNSVLEELDLQGNNLKEGVLDVFVGATRAKALKTINLGDNKFSEDTPGIIEGLLHLFKENKTLENYTLIGNLISDVGAQKLIHGIIGQSHLKKVLVPERCSARTFEALEQALGAGSDKKKGGKKKKK